MAVPNGSFKPIIKSHIQLAYQADQPTRAPRKGAEAPDEPFAVGRFKVQLEREDGSRVPRALGLDDKRRKRGRLVLCGSCDEYIYAAERQCPHCGSSTDSKPAIDEIPAFDLRATIAEIEYHGRRILEIAGMMGEEMQASE